MFARTYEISIFKSLFHTIQTMVEIGNIQCSSTGLTLQALDTTHVCLIDCTLNNVFFDAYQFIPLNPSNFTVDIGVSVRAVDDVLKNGKKNDTLVLSCSREEGKDTVESLELMIENSARVSTYTLKLVDHDAESLATPDIDYEVCATLESVVFKEVVSSLFELSDTVYIRVERNRIVFGGNNEQCKAKVSFHHQPVGVDGGTHISSAPGESVIMGFTYHLKLCAQACNVAELVTLKMNADGGHLLVEYILDDESTSWLRFFLAGVKDGEELTNV